MNTVAHVLRKFNPDEWGGTETHVAAVTGALGPYGWNSEVHAPSGPDAGAAALPSDVALKRFRAFNPILGDAETRRALVANGGNIFSPEAFWGLARAPAITLAHLHTQGRIGGAVRSAMRLTGRPYVVSVHGPLLADPTLVARETARRMKRTVDLGKPVGALLGARRVLDDADAVVCFNDDELHALQDRVGDRAVRMDHGVDLARFDQGDAARGRARWPWAQGKRVVAVLGRLSHQKNQILAVRAFAAGTGPESVLALAGSETDAGMRDAITREAQALGVGDRVFVMGGIDPKTEAPDLLSLAEVLLVPSTHEAFGLVLLEGWASRTPVLFSDNTGLADIARRVGPGCGALPGDDPRDWALALNAVLTQPSVASVMAARGRAEVERRYRWEVVAGTLSVIYQGVLARRGHKEN